MNDPTARHLTQLRQIARERLLELRTTFQCIGLNEKDVLRSLAFSNIVCSLPTSETQWLMLLQEANVYCQERRIAEGCIKNPSQSQP